MNQAWYDRLMATEWGWGNNIGRGGGISFDERIEQLRGFYEAEGHAPSRENAETNRDYPGLGRWLEARREAINNTNTTAAITPEQASAIAAILGANWSRPPRGTASHARNQRARNQRRRKDEKEEKPQGKPKEG